MLTTDRLGSTTTEEATIMARGVKGSGTAAKVKGGKKAAVAESKVAKVAKTAKAPKAKAERVAAAANSGGVIDRSRYSYETHKDEKTASGRASVDNGDPLAAALRGKTSEDVIALVDKNGGTVNPAWETRNQGLARMAAGNVLRALAKRPEGVKIDGKTLKIAA